MKKWPAILAMTGTLLAGQTQPAHAINKEWSAALGFLGGVLVANNCGPSRYERSSTVVYRDACPPPPPVVVYERPACPPPVIIREEPRGYYELQERKVWVPGRWDYQEVGCNTYRKVWQPGYYRTETVRVWVESDCGPRGRYAYR